MFQALFSTPRSSGGREARTRAEFLATWPTSAGQSQSVFRIRLDPSFFGHNYVEFQILTFFTQNMEISSQKFIKSEL